MSVHQIYHKLNILSEEEFSAVVAHKDNIINKGAGATTFEKDGSIRINLDLQSQDLKWEVAALASRYKRANDFAISKEAVVNFQCNIDNFIKVYGEPFYPAFENIRKALIEIGVENPRPYTSRAYRHDDPYLPWHKHANTFKMHPNDYWITIMYLHPNWDIKHGGALRVGITEDEDLLVAECFSNSVVIHNGYYGHGVLKIYPGFEDHRDILLIQWVSEKGYQEVFL